MCWPHQVGVSMCHLAFIVVVKIFDFAETMVNLRQVSFAGHRSQVPVLLIENTPYSKMAAILVIFCLHANWPLWPHFQT